MCSSDLGASVQYSSALIVPSAGMKRVLLDCYPQCPSDRIRVMPWGALPTTSSDSTPLRQEFGVPANAKVILTMSRLSPEKGIDGLLKSLAENERDDVWLFVCGESAFMKGEAYERKIRALAEKLKKIKVVFPGYVSGERKRQFFALANVFVFPSIHESYGLTLMEALAAGLPAVCTPTSGAKEIMRPEFGELAEAKGLAQAIYRVMEKKWGRAPQEYAAAHPFAECAAQIGSYCSEN